MNKVTKFIKDLFHIHWYNKPIVSQYQAFHSRRIIYQCRCGCKQSEFVTKRYGEPFPIETTPLLSNEEFEKILYS